MKFRQALFWDTDPKKIDPKKHARYIIERILELGDSDEIAWIFRQYSKNDIKKVMNLPRAQVSPKIKGLMDTAPKITKQESDLRLDILPKTTAKAFQSCAYSTRYCRDENYGYFSKRKKTPFFDVFWLCKNMVSLEEIIISVNKQYTIQQGLTHILKSLVYFEDAEADPDPVIFFKANWKEVKKFFSKEIPLITKNLIKLK